MSEEVKEVVAEEKPNFAQTLQEAIWEEKPMAAPKQAQEAAAQPAEPTPSSQEAEEILDPKDWLKREFEVDSVDVLKAEREELKRLKEQSPAEIKFENEQSKHIYELLKEGKGKEVKQFLETQERLEQFTSSEITKDNAEAIIKMGMQLKHPELTAAEISHKFNKQYSIPKEPVQSADELDEEFDARKKDWQEKVSEIEMERTIEAKLLKPELEKAKSQLVLPEIERGIQQKPPTQEELEATKKMQESFLQKSQTIIDSFGGFSAQVKDKDVDFSVAYSLSKEDKGIVSEKLKTFAQANFDANALFLDRWVTDDNQINESQMIEDLSRIYTGKNSDAKIAAEAANQRMELYLKEKKKIVITPDNNGQFLPNGDKTKEQKLQENFWGS